MTQYINFSFLNGKIHRNSDAGIGMFFITDKGSDVEGNWEYGKWRFGIYVGKYLLEYSQNFGFAFINFFATGLGG
jgi:type IV secretory pathway TraG/TraD family ATPase VirD4